MQSSNTRPGFRPSGAYSWERMNMVIQLIRNATMKLKYSDISILTDPFLASKYEYEPYIGVSRNPIIDLPICIHDVLERIDFILLTHMHSDHFDKTAKKTIRKDMKILCQPEDRVDIEKAGFINVDAITEEYTINGMNIVRFYGQHGYGENLKEMGIVSGYIIKAKGEPTICWLGDTVYTEAVEKILQSSCPEVIICHSSGAVWGKNKGKIIMDDVQTIELCKHHKECRVIAIHMEALDHGTVTRAELRDYADKNGIKPEQLLIPQDGENSRLER